MADDSDCLDKYRVYGIQDLEKAFHEIKTIDI
ncbi:hypothetical protein C5167_011650 [Papaver somniferum]|uniref:Uncharacterized protein n=1 Tax=Papaver somniferum TaxID=3469 RepID=A0A4Y7K7J4_PAPSO|nr:hypothetical protein C5167_011650 [Papaver somniferum]